MKKNPSISERLGMRSESERPRKQEKGDDPMEREFVDTNVFLRYLTGDDRSKYEDCKTLFKKAIEGKIVFATSGLVVAELIWTLLSYYKIPKAEVVEKISIIVGTDKLYIPDRGVIADAL